jgi:hypothetical protein
MTNRVVLAAVMVIALPGCGPDEAVTPDATVAHPDARPSLGEYDEPSDFPRTGCVPGSG